MKTILVVGMLLVAAPLGAQTPASRRADADQMMQRRYQVTLMENVLTSAVRHAAETTGRHLEELTSSPVLLTGTARARGFLLPEYGAFFDVEVPALPVSVTWTMRVMEHDLDEARSLQVIRQFISSHLASLPDAQRTDLEQALRRMQLSVGPVTSSAAAAAADERPRAQGAVQAATVATPPVPAAQAPAAAQAVEPSRQVTDPGAEYTDVVKDALIDAMLNFGHNLGIGANEWLTVAARDSYGPIAPGEIYDATTVVLRIKGSDLAAFRAGRLTIEDARQRVEVRGF